MFDYFTGEDDLKVDTKGRVTIPHRIRRVVERGDPDFADGRRPTLFVVYGEDDWNRLECYTVASHRRLIKRIRMLPQSSPDRAPALALYATRALETQIDEEGRITIPTRHRERLNLARDVYLSSKLDHFRIWRRENYSATEGDIVAAWSRSKGPTFELDSMLPELDDED